MTQQTIITTPANSQLGDSPKSAFDKCNANFTDLYVLVAAAGGGGGSGGGVYNVSISTTLPAGGATGGTNDNLNPSGYVAGVTNRLILIPTSPQSNLFGLLAATDGWSLWMYNAGTVPILLKNLSSSVSANQFQCPNNTDFSIAPAAGKLLVYQVNQWTMTT